MTMTLAEQENKKLLEAIETATVEVQLHRKRQAPIARDVRAAIVNISIDTMMPLPVPLQCLLPPATTAIMGEMQLEHIVEGLVEFQETLQ